MVRRVEEGGKREERNASYLLLSVWKIGILGTTTASESYNIFSQDSQGVVPAPCLLADGGGGRSDHEQGVTGAKTEWDVAQSLLFGLDRRQHPTQISHLSRGSPVPRPGPTQASNLFGSNVENLARVGIVAS